jgi:hypothetical protein
MQFFLRPVGLRGENHPRYFFRLIHLHKVASRIAATGKSVTLEFHRLYRG